MRMQCVLHSMKHHATCIQRHADYTVLKGQTYQVCEFIVIQYRTARRITSTAVVARVHGGRDY